MTETKIIQKTYEATTFSNDYIKDFIVYFIKQLADELDNSTYTIADSNDGGTIAWGDVYFKFSLTSNFSSIVIDNYADNGFATKISTQNIYIYVQKNAVPYAISTSYDLFKDAQDKFKLVYFRGNSSQPLGSTSYFNAIICRLTDNEGTILYGFDRAYSSSGIELYFPNSSQNESLSLHFGTTSLSFVGQIQATQGKDDCIVYSPALFIEANTNRTTKKSTPYIIRITCTTGLMSLNNIWNIEGKLYKIVGYKQGASIESSQPVDYMTGFYCGQA